MANSSRTGRKSKKNRSLTPNRFQNSILFERTNLVSESRSSRPFDPSTSSGLRARTIGCLFLVLLGVALLFVANRHFLVLSQKVERSSQVAISTQENQLLVKPIKLYIPKLSRVLAISDGEVINDRWMIAETGVSYLTSSVLPGKTGNSVIYGHNKTGILGGLPRLIAGDLIYIVLDNGEFAKYEVFETKEVLPSQVEILNETGDARLTIYTCSGFLDQARFVVVARLV